MDFPLVPSNDPGDETQRNFRYQNAYGVILLIAAGRGAKPYQSIWCEYHEDLLAECQDGTLDAYQIKTRKPEEGLWDLRDEPLIKSLRGFVNLYKLFNERIRNYYFVSNASFPKSNQFLGSRNSKFANNPAAFLEKIHSVSSYEDIEDPFKDTFNTLISFCQCTEKELFIVLNRVDFIPGPSRQDFDAVIAHDHLTQLPQCSLLKPQALNQIRNDLVMKIYLASSLFSDDPDRHITPLYSKLQNRPEVEAKRVSVQQLFEVIESDKQKIKNESSWQTSNNLLFICHSSPDGDEFAKWLSFQLINNGYAVWCDLINLQPGAESEIAIKEIIQKETSKFIFIISKDSITDLKSLDQLQLAYDKMKSDGLDNFIIPLELGLDHPEIFLIKKISPLLFSASWAQGLGLLLDTLSSNSDLQKKSGGPATSNQIWRSIFDPEQGVFVSKDEYISNWFKINEFPKTINFHKLKRIGGIGSIQIPSNLPFPAVTHNIYSISFANAEDYQGNLGNSEICETIEVPTMNFLDGNYDHRLIMPNHVKNILVQLLNKGWENFITKSDLLPYQMANGKTCYYYHKGIGDEMVSFDGVNHKRSRRSLWGYKTVVGVGGLRTKKYWHYGITSKAISSPEILFVIKAHVLFSDDAVHIWDSKSRLHAARRSWCNNWWNPQWRDRLLAILAYLSKNQPTFEIYMGGSSSVIVSSDPMIFSSPMSYIGPKDQMPVEDEEETEVLDLDLLEDYPFEKESGGYDE